MVTVVVLAPQTWQTARRLCHPPFSFQFRRCAASSLEVQNLATDRAHAGGTFRTFIARGWVDQNQAMAARIGRSPEAILVLRRFSATVSTFEQTPGRACFKCCMSHERSLGVAATLWRPIAGCLSDPKWEGGFGEGFIGVPGVSPTRSGASSTLYHLKAKARHSPLGFTHCVRDAAFALGTPARGSERAPP